MAAVVDDDNATCVLVQVEESVVAGKLLLASMRRLRPAWNYELKDLLDMEMVGGPVLRGVRVGP
jgi:hypothetical protein